MAGTVSLFWVLWLLSLGWSSYMGLHGGAWVACGSVRAGIRRCTSISVPNRTTGLS